MWNGWRDGLHGLPALSTAGDAGSGAGTGTPTGDALRALYEHHSATEEALAAPAISARQAAVTSAIEQHDHAVQQVAAALIVLAELPDPTERELTTRRIAEADLPESLVRQRRLREHEKHRSALRRRIEQLDATSQQRLQQQRSAEAARDGLLAAHAERIHQLRAHSRRRLATYWKQLVRRHPEGVRLNRVLAPESPTLPTRTPAVSA